MGAYEAVHPPGHPTAGKPCTNSGTCILVCCYMNALGKVLLKGRGSEEKRFHEFLEHCMPGFLAESARKLPPLTPKQRNKRNRGEEVLYKSYRCGFVHSFYPDTNSWSRFPSCQDYWYSVQPNLVLNIDELVHGFQQGMDRFKQIAQANPDLRSRFKDYILKK